MADLKVAFIGAGNMAGSIIGGLIEQGFNPADISASDPSQESLQRLSDSYAVNTGDDNSAAVADANIVVLAIKPQVMHLVTADICDSVAAADAVVISIAAGITIASLEAGLGKNTAIVRCMPNTPALLRAGATALYANNNTGVAQRQQAQTVLAAVGVARWVEEEHMLDAVTALSGSGPAYFFLFLEALVTAGEELGLDRQTSLALALQTGVGATRMAAESDVDLIELRRRVSSPGGTTERAIQAFEAGGLRSLVKAAVEAARERAEEMGRENFNGSA